MYKNFHLLVKYRRVIYRARSIQNAVSQGQTYRNSSLTRNFMRELKLASLDLRSLPNFCLGWKQRILKSKQINLSLLILDNYLSWSLYQRKISSSGNLTFRAELEIRICWVLCTSHQFATLKWRHLQSNLTYKTYRSKVTETCQTYEFILN